MKWNFLIVFCIIVLGCSPRPSKEAHIKQIKQAIASAGGEAVILKESRILFARVSTQAESIPYFTPDDGRGFFEGLAGVTNLGDVFYYESYQPDRIEIRVHNSHEDTYFIELLNPNLPEPTNFERIEGNVGFGK